jgi:flagellar protein FliO/FliZ
MSRAAHLLLSGVVLTPLAHADGAPAAFAAPASGALGAASGAAGVSQVTLALAVVLIAIFAVAWVARRLRGVGRRIGGAIEILGDVALGQKERAVLLKVGNARLLVGVAPGQVRTLHVLGADEVALFADGRAAAGSAASAASEAVGGATGLVARPNFRSLLLKSLGR